MMATSDKTILFADLSGFTALTEAHGDRSATDIALRFYDMARSTLRRGAVLVKTIGDAVMIVCDDVKVGASIALDLHELVDAAPGFPMLRAGLNSGPVVEARGDVFGSTVNLAARVAAHARSGQTLCTEREARWLRDVDFVVVRLVGTAAMKNVLHEVVLYEVRRDELAEEICVDPVCRMRLTPEAAIGHIRHEGAI